MAPAFALWACTHLLESSQGLGATTQRNDSFSPGRTREMRSSSGNQVFDLESDFRLEKMCACTSARAGAITTGCSCCDGPPPDPRSRDYGFDTRPLVYPSSANMVIQVGNSRLGFSSPRNDVVSQWLCGAAELEAATAGVFASPSP